MSFKPRIRIERRFKGGLYVPKLDLDVVPEESTQPFVFIFDAGIAESEKLAKISLMGGMPDFNAYEFGSNVDFYLEEGIGEYFGDRSLVGRHMMKFDGGKTLTRIRQLDYHGVVFHRIDPQLIDRVLALNSPKKLETT